jgi:hypothetical protein
MRLFNYLFVFITLFAANTGFAEIVEVDDIFPILEAVQTVDHGSLIVFDVHDVLTIPADQVLKHAYKARLKHVLAEVAVHKGDDEAAMLEVAVKRQHRVELVEPLMGKLLQILKARSLRAIALTNARTGELDGELLREDLLFSRLRSVGIDFTDSFPGFSFVMTDCFDGQSLEGAPAFKNGVVFTCHLPKGVVLQSFLNKVEFQPAQIVFVDDKRSNLESVEAFCKKTNIPFIGFHYIGSTRCSSVPLNEMRAEFQLTILREEGLWLSDKEADERLSLKDG